MCLPVSSGKLPLPTFSKAIINYTLEMIVRNLPYFQVMVIVSLALQKSSHPLNPVQLLIRPRWGLRAKLEDNDCHFGLQACLKRIILSPFWFEKLRKHGMLLKKQMIARCLIHNLYKTTWKLVDISLSP